MREIKFRVWETLTKTMNPLAIFSDDEVADIILKAPTVENVVLLQYTGLKDKTGKEIYEGDIVASLPTPHLTVDRLLFEVYWQPRLACWAYKSLSTVSPKFYTEHEFMESNLGMNTPPVWYPLEVIGNIYENPELTAPPNKEGAKNDR